jgi:hypothetical protein
LHDQPNKRERDLVGQGLGRHFWRLCENFFNSKHLLAGTGAIVAGAAEYTSVAGQSSTAGLQIACEAANCTRWSQIRVIGVAPD